jgi:hypothetical protein
VIVPPSEPSRPAVSTVADARHRRPASAMGALAVLADGSERILRCCDLTCGNARAEGVQAGAEAEGARDPVREHGTAGSGAGLTQCGEAVPG